MNIKTNYPIGDFLIRIKNCVLAGNKYVEAKSTNLVKNTAKTLERAGFLSKVETKNGKIKVLVSYKNKKALLMDLKLISKPGRRVYMSCEDLENHKGPSIYILSTNQGILSSQEALKKRVGGEVIAKVW